MSQTVGALEQLWFGYHAIVSTLSCAVGIYGYVEDAAAGSSETPTSTTNPLRSTPSAQKKSLPTALFSGIPSNALVQVPSSAARLADRDSILKHRQTIDSVSTLIGMALFQNHTVSDLHMPQYAVSGDAMVAFLAMQGLTVKSPAERRLIHRCLSFIKATQFLICMWDDRHTGTFMAANTVGLGLCALSTLRWGGVLMGGSAKSGITAPKKASNLGGTSGVKHAWPFGNSRVDSTASEGGEEEGEGKVGQQVEVASVAAMSLVESVEHETTNSVAEEVLTRYNQLRNRSSEETLSTDILATIRRDEVELPRQEVDEALAEPTSKVIRSFSPVDRSGTFTFNTGLVWDSATE